MAVSVGAMTGRFSATAVGKREGTWKSVVRDMEARHQPARAEAEPGGVSAAGRRNVVSADHLLVILQAEQHENKTPGKWF
jgi:hypothetical protein